MKSINKQHTNQQSGSGSNWRQDRSGFRGQVNKRTGRP